MVQTYCPSPVETTRPVVASEPDRSKGVPIGPPSVWLNHHARTRPSSSQVSRAPPAPDTISNDKKDFAPMVTVAGAFPVQLPPVAGGESKAGGSNRTTVRASPAP